MKVKTILRKANRGLILGLVLLIGLIVFIVVDEQNFQKQQPVIQETVEQYLQDVSGFSIFPEEYQKLDAKVPESAIADQKAKIQEVLDRYWVSQAGDSWVMNKDQVLSDLSNMLVENSKGEGYVSQWTGISTGKTQITKTGPGRAKVVFPYSVVVEIHGVAMTNNLTGMIYIDHNGKQGEVTDEEKNQVKKYSVEGNFEVEMTYVNGEWKFLEGYYGYYTANSAVATNG